MNIIMCLLQIWFFKILVMEMTHPQDHQLPLHQMLSSSSYGYVHILAEVFKQLLASLDMIQKYQANIQLTQQQLV